MLRELHWLGLGTVNKKALNDLVIKGFLKGYF